jgi:hypothetical protein
MKKSLKGVLLSGLVFPGLGQVALKRYKRGVAIIVAVFACLMIIIIQSVQQALFILERMQSKDGEINLKTISEVSAYASANLGGWTFNFALILIIFLWFFSIIDSYRIGKREGQ